MRKTSIEVLTEQMVQRLEDNTWFVSLKTSLDGVTAPVASWRPNDQFNTIWQIVNHLRFWTQFVSDRLNGAQQTGNPIDNQSTFGEPGDPSDEIGWQNTVSDLYEVYNEFLKSLKRVDIKVMDQILNSAETPASTMIGGCLMHDSYHIGQIVLLRRLQDDWTNQK